VIFEINTRDDWVVKGPHVLRAIKVIFHTNVRLALNENEIQKCLARRPFLSCKFLVHRDMKTRSITS